MKPFMSLLEDFWFYQYHETVYPDFVDSFTSEVDVLNELRIKPSFISYDIEIPRLADENQKLNQTCILQSRAPGDKLFFLSTKDIYTSNLAMTLLTFAVFKLLSRLARPIRYKHGLFRSLYKFLRINSIWWMLLVCFFESNLAPLVFFACVQLNSFVAFDLLTKANLVAATLLLFCSICYTFLFYPMIYKYGKKSSR